MTSPISPDDIVAALNGDPDARLYVLKHLGHCPETEARMFAKLEAALSAEHAALEKVEELRQVQLAYERAINGLRDWARVMNPGRGDGRASPADGGRIVDKAASQGRSSQGAKRSSGSRAYSGRHEARRAAAYE